MTTGRTLSIPKMIWSVLRPRWQLLSAVLLLIPVGALLELVHPFVLKRLVDDHFTTGVADGLGTLAAVYVLAFVSIQAVTFLQTYLAATVGQNALRDLRVHLFRHFESLPVGYFDRTPSGDVISRCTADVDAVGHLSFQLGFDLPFYIVPELVSIAIEKFNSVVEVGIV